MKRRSKRQTPVRPGTPKAGPVTIRRADGTTEVQEALTKHQVENRVRKGEKQPRTWDSRL